MGEGDLTMSNLPDKVSKVFLNVIAVVVAGGITLIFLLGFYDFFKHQENKCEMTWMYEFPHFVRIPLKNGMDEKYPMYGLYIYAEGRQVEAARRGEYSGIPVLFLPGNAGSYKQVRSFASVALYKAIDMKSPFHFDFYTIDFNEEASGLYGYVLGRQLEYSRLALDHIINLYEDFHHVVIIGHSMGGIIAKTINADEIKSHLIITLATPHAHPVLITDPEFDLFYYNSWKNFSRGTEPEVTVVSVAGGDHDLLVMDKLTQSPTNDFQTSTVAIPGAWVSADHLCILWCNQFVKVVVRILFDLVEYKSIGSGEEHIKMTTNKELIDTVLEYHLYKRPSGKSYHTAFPNEKTVLPPKAVWDELLSLKSCKEDAGQKIYSMFPVQVVREKVDGDDDGEYRVLVTTSNTKAKNWVFGCKEQDFHNGIRYCSKMDNLSPHGEILQSRRKVVHLKYEDVKKYSHIVAKATPSPVPFCTHLEVYKVPNSEYLPRNFKTEKRIFFQYSAKNLDKRVSAWRIDAKTNDSVCINETISVALFDEDHYQSHAFLGNQSLMVRFTNWSSEDAKISFYFNPQCDYNVTLRLAYIETAGQIFRTYIWLLPAYITSIVMLSFFFQKHHEDWENFHWLLLKNAFHLTVVPGTIIGGLLCCIPSDYLKVMDKSEVSVFLPLILFSASLACVFLLTAAGWYLLIGSGNALHAFVMKFLSKKLGKIPDKVAEHALEIVFAKFPVIVAVFLVSLSTATCGGLGIAAGFFVYLFKIFKMYEDLLEDLLKGKIKDVREGLSPLNFHQTCLSLWFIVMCLNIPSVIFWVKNLSYGQSPQWDMSLYISLMLTPAVAILWQEFVPKFNPSVWTMQRYLAYVNGILVVLWGTHRLYIVSFVITLHLITMAFTQLVSCLLSLASKAEEASAVSSAAAAAADDGATEDQSSVDATSDSTKNEPQTDNAKSESKEASQSVEEKKKN